MRRKAFRDKIQHEYLPYPWEKIVMAREIFGPDHLPYRQEKQM